MKQIAIDFHFVQDQFAKDQHQVSKSTANELIDA